MVMSSLSLAYVVPGTELVMHDYLCQESLHFAQILAHVYTLISIYFSMIIPFTWLRNTCYVAKLCPIWGLCESSKVSGGGDFKKMAILGLCPHEQVR